MNKAFYALSFAKKIFVAILSLVLFFIVSFAFVAYFHFYKATEVYNVKTIESKENAILKSLEYIIDGSSKKVTEDNFSDLLQNRIFELRDLNGVNIHFFSLENKLLTSTQPFNKKIISKNFYYNKVDDKLENNNFSVLLKMPSENGIDHFESYRQIKNNFDEPLGILNLSFHSDNSFIKSEYFSLLKTLTIFLLTLSVLIIFASWLISYGLTRKLSIIAYKIKNTDFLNDNLSLDYSNNDEIGILIESYNQLKIKVKKQYAELIEAERENAWREMAKQVAHEIKNPLTPMLLSIQNFNRKFDESSTNAKEKLNELCESLSNQIESLKLISESFSDFAKVPKRNDQNLDLINETKKIIKLYNHKNIIFSTLETDLFYEIDKLYWNRILTNIIKNAIQATPDGRESEVLIKIVKTNFNVEIFISDNGTGIESINNIEIFKPNFTTKNSGMGLGLAMTKKMIEEYNGEISYSNNKDMGCTFLIRLPV